MEANTAAYDILSVKVKELAKELPGVTFGYIGNVGVDRSGPFDDRSWRIFLPHPGRVGESLRDTVYIGATPKLVAAVQNWDTLAAHARVLYQKESRQ